MKLRRGEGGWPLSSWLAAVAILILATTAVGGGVAFSLWLQEGVPPGPPDPPPAPDGRDGPVEIAGTVLPPPQGSVYWGAYRLGIPDDRRVLPHLSQLTGATPAIAMYFQVWEGQPSFDVEGARWLASQGIVPMVSWEPWTPQYDTETARLRQPKYRLERIAGGAFDGFIELYAQKVREYGGPLFLRPFHEMDGDWYPWAGTVNGNTPEDLVAAWRHIHDIFSRVGATNVTWVWSVNHVSAATQDDVHRYWPGARFVDWIGISGFNWGPSPDSSGLADPTQVPAVVWASNWDDFATVYASRYGELLRYRKPIVLTEMSSVETGGDKAAWIRDSVATVLEDFPRIRGFIWYDRALPPRDWRIDSTLASLLAFREVVAGPGVLSAPHAAQTSREPGTADQDGLDPRF